MSLFIKIECQILMLFIMYLALGGKKKHLKKYT